MLPVLLSCARPPALSAPPAPSPDVVTFLDRAIHLGPHLTGYPYRDPLPLFDAGQVVYEEVGEARRLRVAPMGDAPPDLARGALLSEVDWSTRSRRELHHHAPTRALWFAGDERNDERFNLYRLDLGTSAITAVTDEDYLYGWSFSPAEDTIALVVRRGAGPYESCLETLATDGTGRQRRVCDTMYLGFTWGEPSWAPDARGVVLEVNVGGRRDLANLAWVPFDDPVPRLLLEEGRTRTVAAAVGQWLDDRSVVVVDDALGPTRIGVATIDGGVAWTITLEGELGDLRLLRPGERPVLVGVARHPDGDHVLAWDPRSGAVLGDLPAGGEAKFLGEDDHARLVVATTSVGSPFRSSMVDVGPDGALAALDWLRVPEATERQLVHCDVTPVSFPTHDLDPATRQPRVLHGFLATPRAPLDPPVARIVSFYGGANRFDVDTQIWCEAGVATLSPAVRGSRGYGAAFYRLNDGDLGGDEIADLFEAARFLVGQGYPEDHIGVWGRSHGGYASMRALTFPPGTNGHDEVFPFAFGMADAGFSDILTFHATSNIPDWVILEAGDPAYQADKLRDRSPLSHVDRLRAPLLLIHGENDRRVPVAESRQMAAACEAAGQSCTYLEVPGQGHVVRGLANEQRVWQARMSFLEEVLSSPSAAP